MPDREPAYPPLDRTAFLIEHSCVAGAYPSYCAEAAQVLTALAERLKQSNPQKNDTTSP